MECLKVRRLLPWPPKAGLFADFAHAVDRVLEAEEQEHRARPDRFSDGLWKCRAEAWRRRRSVHWGQSTVKGAAGGFVLGTSYNLKVSMYHPRI